MLDLREQFGDIDIYLFDQLLRGRIGEGMRVLDMGCGAGRNLVHLLRAGFEVFGVDADPAAIQSVQSLASRARRRGVPSSNFRVAPVGGRHVSGGVRRRRDQQRRAAASPATTRSSARCCAGRGACSGPGGCSSASFASSIGMEAEVRSIAGRRHRLPDGSTVIWWTQSC